MKIFDRFKKKEEKDLQTVASAAEGVKKETKSPVSGSVLGAAVVSEKSANLQSANVYAFFVDKNANKRQIAQVIKEKYGHEALSIKIVNTKGKIKTWRGISGKRKDIKKAYIALPKGKTISVHENV